MMLFQVTYTMHPGQRDAFLRMMRESGILDQIRREEGCLDYRYYLPKEEDGTLLLVERWTGPEAQKAHMDTEHMARGDQRSLLGVGLSAGPGKHSVKQKSLSVPPPHPGRRRRSTEN